MAAAWEMQVSSGNWVEAPFKPPASIKAGKKCEFVFEGVPCVIEFTSLTVATVTAKNKTYIARLKPETSGTEKAGKGLESSGPKPPGPLTLVPGEDASVLGREWRCKFADGEGSEGGLIKSKADVPPGSASFESCHEILEKAAADAEASKMQEHIEALKAMLPDMNKQPSKPRIRQMAKLLGVPQMVQYRTLPMPVLFQNVQHEFLKCVFEQRGADPSGSGCSHTVAFAREARTITGPSSSCSSRSAAIATDARAMKRPAAALTPTQNPAEQPRVMKPKGRTEEYRQRNAKRKSDTRSRKGRKQKQNREGRKQNRDRRHRKTLRVLNVQRPWARLLLTGAKKVEVRKYPLKNYMDEDLWLLETKGERAPRDFASAIIGAIRFGQDFEYQDLPAFRADEHRHCIPQGSSFDWQPSKTPKLYGWVVQVASLLARSLPPPKTKGMIGAKACGHRTTLPE